MKFKKLTDRNYTTVRDKIFALFNWVNNQVDFQEPITLTDASTITWDCSNNYNAKVTLGGSRTLSVINLQAGTYGMLEVVQGGSGSYTLTLPSSSKVANGGGGAVTLSTGVGDIDCLSFYYNGTTMYWTISTDFT